MFGFYLQEVFLCICSLIYCFLKCFNICLAASVDPTCPFISLKCEGLQCCPAVPLGQLSFFRIYTKLTGVAPCFSLQCFIWMVGVGSDSWIFLLPQAPVFSLECCSALLSLMLQSLGEAGGEEFLISAKSHSLGLGKAWNSQALPLLDQGILHAGK